jgi:hypothetical protein
MAIKKIMNPKSSRGGPVVERKLHGGNFGAKMNLKDGSPSKLVRRRTKAAHAADDLEVIGLTEAELARIEEVCARNTVISDYVLTAITSPWKRSAV